MSTARENTRRTGRRWRGVMEWWREIRQRQRDDWQLRRRQLTRQLRVESTIQEHGVAWNDFCKASRIIKSIHPLPPLDFNIPLYPQSQSNLKEPSDFEKRNRRKTCRCGPLKREDKSQLKKGKSATTCSLLVKKKKTHTFFILSQQAWDFST